MNKQLPGFIVLIFISCTAIAHHSITAPLKSRLENGSDSGKVKTLIGIGDNYRGNNSYESAMVEYFNALKLSETI